MAQQLDAKPRVDHIELTDTNNGLKEEYDTIQLKSDQDQLSWAKTLWKFRKAVFICNLICMVGACDGYQINLNGSIIANAGFTRKIGFLRADGRYALNAKHTATWGGLQSGGQAISFMFIHPISDRLGRKYTLYLMWLILMAALLIETFVQTWQQWAGAKLLAGMGIGALQMTLPVYIAEFSPVNIRGSMVLAYGIWNNIGNFLAPVVLLASERKDRFDYQTPIRTQWAFLGISLFVLLYLPETPSYYAAKGQHEKGKASLRRVFGGVPGYDIEHEYNITVQTLEQERTLAAENAVRGWKDLLQSYADCFRGSNLRRTFGAPMSFILQQLTGLSFLNIYAALFFRQAGFARPFDITAILTAIKICGILTCIVLADNIGRRRLILFAGVWCTLMMFVVGAAGQKATTEPIKNLVIAAACFWSVANSPLGSLGYTLVGEVPPQRLRARMSGVANTFSTITGIIFNTTMPIMLDVNGRNLGYNTAWVFAGLGSIACVAAYFLVPETARRNSAELDELYEKRIPCRKMRQYVTDVQREQNTRLGLSGGVAHSVLA